MDVIENPEQFSIPPLNMKKLFIGKNPLSQEYGKIIGFFSCKAHNYRFTYQIHTPIYPQDCRLTDLEEIQTTFSKSGQRCETYIFTTFGHKAFWIMTPPEVYKDTDQDSYCLYLLSKKLKEYIMQEKLLKYYLSADRIAIQKNPNFCG